MKTVLLQCKFFLVAYLNFSYMFFPNPLRNYYLRLFGIKIDKGSCIHRCCNFFHVGKFTMGQNSVVNFGCYLGTFIKYYKISQLIHTQSIAN